MYVFALSNTGTFINNYHPTENEISRRTKDFVIIFSLHVYLWFMERNNEIIESYEIKKSCKTN